MIGMSDLHNDGFSIECGTCVATGTTACADCVVSHLLANDDGPIEFVTVAPPVTATDRAIALFARAGMLDDPVRFVELEEFERGIGAGLAVVR
jgi:hypothetical protein